VVNTYHDSLLDSKLGKSKSAFAAIQVIKAIINSDTNMTKRVLTDEKNNAIV
jgi:hypothetical protein